MFNVQCSKKVSQQIVVNIQNCYVPDCVPTAKNRYPKPVSVVPALQTGIPLNKARSTRMYRCLDVYMFIMCECKFEGRTVYHTISARETILIVCRNVTKEKRRNAAYFVHVGQHFPTAFVPTHSENESNSPKNIAHTRSQRTHIRSSAAHGVFSRSRTDSISRLPDRRRFYTATQQKKSATFTFTNRVRKIAVAVLAAAAAAVAADDGTTQTPVRPISIYRDRANERAVFSATSTSFTGCVTLRRARCSHACSRLIRLACSTIGDPNIY